MRHLIILIASVGITASACAQTTLTAQSPDIPSDAPYIALTANLDEPNNYGFCLDTYGAGQSDLMQTHTCKPTNADKARDFAGNDTRFTYNEESQQVMSYAFQGYCMQALIASEVTVFALLECSDHARQRFLYNAEDASFRLAEDQTRCVTVATETVPAGPWVKRPLQLETCNDVEASLRSWTVVTE